jgi:hypothetical protein
MLFETTFLVLLVIKQKVTKQKNNMGAQMSTVENTVRDLTDICVSVMVDNFSSCSAAAIQQQSIRVNEVRGDLLISDVSMKSKGTILGKCLQETKNDTEITNEIKKALEQYAEAKNQGQNIGFQGSRVSNTVDLITKVTNAIRISNVRESLSSSTQLQSIEASSIFGNVIIQRITFEAATEVILESITKDVNVMKSINDLATDITQTGFAKNAGMMGSTSSLLSIWVMVVFLIVLTGITTKQEVNNL